MEKSYKLVNNGSDKQIAYPIGMSDDCVPRKLGTSSNGGELVSYAA